MGALVPVGEDDTAVVADDPRVPWLAGELRAGPVVGNGQTGRPGSCPIIRPVRACVYLSKTVYKRSSRVLYLSPSQRSSAIYQRQSATLLLAPSFGIGPGHWGLRQRDETEGQRSGLSGLGGREARISNRHAP